MSVPEDMSAREMVRRVVEEAMSLDRSLDSDAASGKGAFDSAVRMRILTGELCHKILSDRKEGKTANA